GQPGADDKAPPKREGAGLPKPEAEQPPQRGVVMEEPGPVPDPRLAPILGMSWPMPRGPLEQALLENIPAIDLGDVRLTAAFASSVQRGYDLAYSLGMDHFSFYLGVFLLGLTLLSWIGHRPARAHRRGPPVFLAPGVGPV